MTDKLTRRDAFAFASALAVGVAAVAAAPGEALADQPNMRNALASLQDAKRWLEQANTGKGGHRAAAIRLIDEAISEVKQGIKFANS
jgi:hypothetical protein